MTRRLNILPFTDRNIAYKPSPVYSQYVLSYRLFSLTSHAQLTLAQRWHLSPEERWNPSEATSSLTRPLQECFFAKVLSQCSWKLLLVIIPSPGRAEERVVKLVDSPDRPESEASYKLDEGGWADVWEISQGIKQQLVTMTMNLPFCFGSSLRCWNGQSCRNVSMHVQTSFILSRFNV